MNHLIAKSYRFPLKSAISLQLSPSSSPIPQRLHSPLWLSLFSMQLQSISWSTWSCSRRHAVFSLCKHPSATSVLFRLSLSSGTIVHHLPAFPSQHVLSLEFYLNHLIQFLQLNIIDSADFHCVGCNRYNLQFIALIRLASLSSVFAIIFTLFDTSSFKHHFRSDTMNLFHSQEFIDFVFIWVHGLHSFFQHLKTFSSHHLAMFEYGFRKLWHSIAGSGVVAGFYNDLVDIL